MADPKQTLDDTQPQGRRGREARPGLVLVVEAGRPTMRVVPVGGRRIPLGREGPLALDDDRVTRAHAEIARGPVAWTIADLDSRNGTFVDGQRIVQVKPRKPKVIRIGHSLMVAVDDVTPYEAGDVQVTDGVIVGPHLQDKLTKVRRTAKSGAALLINGPSGSGKELAARTYHDASPSSGGPFVAVNCATIPEGLAERLLFGAAKGAYSGADADSRGYLQAASGGTLFLDELAELDSTVQAKLLRVLESSEVTPLGMQAPESVDVQVVSATHADLRKRVAAGEFREDLYFRIAVQQVRLPALRERPAELCVFVTRAVQAVNAELVPHALLLEQCLLRDWPGNVRELLAAITAAADEALADDRDEVLAEDLDPDAGRAFGAGDDKAPLDRAAIVMALAQENDNISATARRLGLHRTQLRRLMDRYDIGG